MSQRYWRKDSDAPFATMLSIIDTYCHPEAHDEAREELIALARNPDGEMVRFKEEIRRVLSGDTGGLRPGAISIASEHADNSDEAFLRRLWGELYPDEPAPQP